MRTTTTTSTSTMHITKRKKIDRNQEKVNEVMEKNAVAKPLVVCPVFFLLLCSSRWSRLVLVLLLLLVLVLWPCSIITPCEWVQPVLRSKSLYNPKRFRNLIKPSVEFVRALVEIYKQVVLVVVVVVVVIDEKEIEMKANMWDRVEISSTNQPTGSSGFLSTEQNRSALRILV